MTNYVIERQIIPTYPGIGALGRNVNHDSRSRGFAYSTAGLTLKDADHARVIPALDQGKLGSCTGNASVGALATHPLASALAKPVSFFSEDLAVDLYSQFTREDGFAGSYKPDDTGSDGLTAGKVCKKRGYISGYQHTFTLNAALLALTETAFIAGINWYDSFDQPVNGLVTITPNAMVRGGHEVQASALDVEKRRIGFWNSWGAGYGVNGQFWMGWDDFGRLLSESGDVTIFAPLNVAPPAPPADPDAVLAATLRRGGFLTRRHCGDNEKAAAACRAWLAATGR